MKKSPNTNKNLIFKLQKPIIFTIFFSMIFLFVYSLIFFTPFYDLYIIDTAFSIRNATNYGVWIAPDASNAYAEAAYLYRNGKIYGLNMQYFVNFTKAVNGSGGELQTFNHFLFNFGLIGIVVSAISFLFYSQKRKVFYPTNFIFLGLSSAFGLGTSIYGIMSLASWSNYLKTGVNYGVINAYSSYANGVDASAIKEYFSYNTFSWVFVLGFIVMILIALVSVAGIVYGVLRFIYQKKNPCMDLSEVNIDE